MMTSTAAIHASEQILASIGRNIGIDDLCFDAQGHRALVFTSGRHFGFQKVAPGLLIYVAEPIRFDVPGTLMEAMQRAHANHAEWTVQVMLREERGVHRDGYGTGDGHETCLLAMIRLSGKQASIPAAQRALGYLAEWNPSRGDR
jgi:hypothetical protein